MVPKGILFIHETHSFSETEKKWIDNFKDKIYDSHGKTNSGGVLITFYSNLNICVKNKVNDNDSRGLILNHDFLFRCFKKKLVLVKISYLIKVLLNNQQSRVINRGFTTPYFNLEKGAHQGDPISAYLFILALEVLLELMKNNADIRGITFFNHAFIEHCLHR